MRLLRQDQLRALERAHADATPALMERAGQAAAALAWRRFGPGRALVCAGPGNNGGDAFVLARVWQAAGGAVDVLFVGEVERLPDDAAAAYRQALATGVSFVESVPPAAYSVVVDGLFGIGLTRPIGGIHAELIARINAFAGPVLALDVPSGLDGDTGAIRGAAVRATLTATFIAAKPGLYTAAGPDHTGEVALLDLGLHVPAGPGALLGADDYRGFLRPRPRNSHKGSFGTLGVFGGASGMLGAALLAGRAGLHLGAGRVMLGLLDQGLAVDPAQPELMLRRTDEALAQASVAVVGPGLGQSDAAAELLRRLASAEFPVLIDADALNLLAAHPVLARQVAKRSAATLLTPHPTEAARLLGLSTAEIQADRIAAASELARRYRATVALKGCGTVLANADGDWRINPSGNAGLASGGSGDVLAGMAGALLAQGLPPWPALIAAVHLHGLAADALVATGEGPAGLTAGELLRPARRLLNRYTAGLD